MTDDLRKVRNQLSHIENKSLFDFHFNQLWNDAGQMLVKHGFDPELVDELKEYDRVYLKKFSHIFSEEFTDIPSNNSLFCLRLTYFLPLDPSFFSVPRFSLFKYDAFDKIYV